MTPRLAVEDRVIPAERHEQWVGLAYVMLNGWPDYADAVVRESCVVARFVNQRRQWKSRGLSCFEASNA